MRRAHIDQGSQVVRNLMTTPTFEAASGNVTVRTNLLPSPRFETAGSTRNVWTNLVTNPSFEASNGTVNLWKNLATNATLEAVAPSTVVHRTNLCINPSFEVSLTGWSLQLLSAGSGRVTSMSLSASSSVWGVANDTIGDSMFTTTTNIAVLPDTKYTISAYAYLPVGITASNFRESSRNLWAVAWAGLTPTVGVGNLDFSKTNQWQRVSTTITTPSNVVGLQIRLYCPNHASGIFWDNVLVEQTDQLRPYFDGSTTDERGWDFAWTGTANASTSTAACASTEIARNLVPNPSMVTSDGTFSMRKNIMTDPRATTAFAGYGSQTITPVTISGHPMGITTANRVSYVSGANNPGVLISQPAANTQYTLSAWVFHETAPTSGSQAFAQSGVTSQPSPPAIVAGQWQRISWTFTTGAGTSQFGFRIGTPVGDGSFLITGILIETAPILDDYFDGSAPAAQRTNLVPSPSAGAAGGWFHAFLAGTVTFSTNNAGGPLGTPFARALVTSTGTGSNYFAVAHGSTTPSLWTPVTAGLTYTASAYVRVTMTNFSQQPKFRLRWKRADGTTISDEPIVSASGVTSGQWVRLSSTGTAPAGAVYAEIMGGYISIDYTTLTVGDTVDVSAALVEQTSTLGTYFDGSTASVPGTSYGWRGSANASVSYAYSSDLSYVWDGAANASTSSQRGNSVTGYMRSGGDTGNPQIITEGTSKILRYVYRTENSAIAINIPSLSASNPSMAGKTYTITAKVRPNFAISGARLRLGGLDGAGFNLTANQWQTVSLTGVYSDTGYTSAIWAPAAGAGNYGKYIDISDVSVVEGVYKGNFFNGSTPSEGDFSYSWTGATHNSASFKKAPRPLNVIASKSGAITGAYFHAISAIENGERYARFISPAGTDNASWRIPMSSGLDYASIVAGSQYTIYVKYRMSGWSGATTVTFGLKDPQSTNPVMQDSNISVTPGSGWQTFSKTFNANISGLSTTNLYIVIPSIPPTDQDGIFDIAEWYLVAGTYSGPVFDGSTPASGDFSYSWSGVVDNSSSYTVANTATNATAVQTNENVAIQSSDWGISGKSVRIIPTSTTGSNNTWVSPGGDSGGMRLGMVAGKTYTVLAKLRITAPQTGTLNSAARSIRVLREGFSSFASTAASPNVAGVYEHRVTFTVPADATQTYIRLYNGASTGNGDVWWDDFLLVEGGYTGPYFDGSRPSVQNLCTNPSFTTNTSSWGGISATTTRVTNQGGDGAVCEITQTVANSTRQGGIFLFGANQPSGDYTISFDMKGIDSTFTDARVLFYDPVTALTRASARTALNKDGNFNRYTFSVTADGVFDRVYVEVLGVNIPLGTKAWLDRVLIERGGSASQYFEGTGDYTYSWSGTANSSTSNQSAPGLLGWSYASNAEVHQSSFPTQSGATKCAAVVTKGAHGDGIYTQDVFGVTSNTVYTLSAWVKTQAVHRLDGVLRWKDASGNTLTDFTSEVTSSITVGKWSRVSITSTSPANSVKVSAMWRIYAPHTPTTFYVDGVTLNEGLDTSYFDGSTPPSTDFTYAWTGTANNSTSTETAAKAVGMTGNYSNRVAYQTSQWSASGSKSLAVVGGSRPNVDTFAQFEGIQPISDNVSGKTYTIMGRLRTFEAFPVGADGRAWSIHIAYNKAGGGTGLINCKPTTTGAGFHEVKQTITFPSDATTVAFMRLYNGSPNNGVVYWDNVMIVEGTYTGDFINPDQNPLARWTGAANQSTSYGYSPQLFDIAGTPSIDLSVTGSVNLPGGYGASDARTFYTVFYNDGILASGVSTIVTYGSTALNDTVPNTFITLRQQTWGVSSGINSIMARRTGGGGAQTGTSKLGANVACWGIDPRGLVFMSGNNAPIVYDGAMVALHERINIQPPTATDRHIRTIMYPGFHDAATRAAVSRYLGNKYGAPVI